ncbi:IS110 family transposase [Arcicella rosea]|uniref:Transposase n=1 Tax=Arcicella rosea TaxID=502909 RepID=A0A841EXE0_9BACT|nr:IS110 family transposase [Arcicella rosea]MBB6005753.1 transposase [Arcicella rosea]
MSKKVINNQTILRQCVGIDISKDSFVACISHKTSTDEIIVKSTKKIPNSLSGYNTLQEWVTKFTSPELPLIYVMEATGVYYEPLAFDLLERGKSVSVQLAKNVKFFMQSHNIKSKTDDIDAQAIAQMGLERKLKLWQPGSIQMRLLKHLCRERIMLQAEQTTVKNQSHAWKHTYKPEKSILKRLENRLSFIKEQIQEIEQEIKSIVENDQDLAKRVANVCTIKGVGLLSAIVIIAETNGFALFNNKAQLISYAGYDVVRKQSGNTEAKTRISKKGNKNIRKALYFPATSACRFNPKMKNTYENITQKTAIKMKGNVAVQRKMLVLIYTIYKNNIPYDENYQYDKERNDTQKNKAESIINCPA